jgi:hypothetical protein
VYRTIRSHLQEIDPSLEKLSKKAFFFSFSSKDRRMKKGDSNMTAGRKTGWDSNGTFM